MHTGDFAFRVESEPDVAALTDPELFFMILPSASARRAGSADRIHGSAPYPQQLILHDEKIVP